MNRREVEQMVRIHGLEIKSLVRNRHWKAKVVNRAGKVYTVTFPNSHSDHRALKNKASQLQNIAVGVV